MQACVMIVCSFLCVLYKTTTRNSHLLHFLFDVVFDVVSVGVFGVVNCLLLLGQRASVCSFDNLFFRLRSLYVGVCLLCTHFSAHFFLFSYSCFLFKLLLKFRNVKNIAIAEAPLSVIEISKKTSHSVHSRRFSFALKRNETKDKLILHENIHTTRE